MRSRDRPFAAGRRGRVDRASLDRTVDAVPVAVLCRAGFHGLPVGYSADRSWLPGDVLCAVASLAEVITAIRAVDDGAVAAAIAAVPPDVRVGCGQIEQRRSDLARPDGDHLPLFHAATSDSAGVVYAPATRAHPQD